MESIEFPTGIAYALSCLGRENVTLKTKQEEAVYHLYHGQDVFAWFPTEYGKSLCYQLVMQCRVLFDYKLNRTSYGAERWLFHR